MASPTRRVRMIAPTYISGVVADVGSEQTLSSAIASEFVGNGRAVYLEPQHNDVQGPPASLPAAVAAAAVALPAKGKSYA